MQDHFLSKARVDIFRPFTGRHRAVFFEVVTEIYERTLGVNADYEIVLDRLALTEIIVDALDKNRSLIFSGEEGDEELDGAGDDRDYADKVRKRLKRFGMIEEYNDSAYLKVLWRFTPEGKRIAKMFADTRRKTSVARQRSVRACKGALKAFSEEGNHEYLVDAYEYASTIFDDVCQVSDLFTEHQRRIMGHSFSTSKEALVGYMLGVNDFDKRASRYFDSDNIYNHASDIVDLTESIASMNPAVLEAADRKMMEEHPALEEEANGERLHTWMLARIRRVVESTRDIKHEELHRVVGEFSTNYAILIGRLIKLSAVGNDDPLIRFAGMFAAAGDEERDEICREMLHHLFPQRADLIDPADLKIADRADRVRTPTAIVRKQRTREEMLAADIRNAMTAAFAVPAKEVVSRVHAAVLANGGSTTVTHLPVGDARQLLAAMSAVEIVRSHGAETGLTVSLGDERRSNGVFRTVDHKISQRA
jgi:hypothetical protein